jgi:hypothetical protein
MLHKWVLVFSLVVAAVACDKMPAGSSSLTSTTGGSTSLNVSGSWSGDLPLQGTATRMTWLLTQAGDSVVGTVVVAQPNGTVVMSGTFSAIVAEPAVRYTIVVAAGGLPAQATCTGQLTGTATAVNGPPQALTGSYSMTSSCTTPFTSGSFTLTKVGS